MEVPFLVAFFGGILTFLSPCVLPLLPIYLACLSGSSGENTRSSSKTLLNAVAFSIGFSSAFVMIGVVFYSLISQFRIGDGFSQFMGLLLVVIGGHTLGLYRIPLLMRDTRNFQSRTDKIGLLGSFALGILFAAGWSPCIGPILAGILALSVNSSETFSAAVLMLTFSAGLSIPFMLSALLANKVGAWLKSSIPFTGLAEKMSGVMIILIGLGLLVFSTHDIANWATENVPWANDILELEARMLGEDT